MRTMSLSEIGPVSGGGGSAGDLQCGFKIGTKESYITCNGAGSSWSDLASITYRALAASPFTVPGIIERYIKNSER